MTIVIVAAVALVGGFVFGVLFGRKNVKTVEADLAAVKAAARSLVEKLGPDALEHHSKTHFKTAAEILSNAP